MRDETTVALNRRARHEFTIDETFEAGIVLTGTEIKSIRAGKVNLSDAYARIEQRRGLARSAPTSPRSSRRQPLQPRAEADPQAAAPPLRDRRAARAGPRPRARRSSRCGSTSTRRAGRSSSWASPAASSSTTAAATSPIGTPTRRRARAGRRAARGRGAAASRTVERPSRRRSALGPTIRGGRRACGRRTRPGDRRRRRGRPGRDDVRQDDLARRPTATTCACGCCASRAATRPPTATSSCPRPTRRPTRAT